MKPTENVATIDVLRQKLAGSSLADDPTRVVLPLDVHQWPEEWRRAMPRALKPAAVLIPVLERGDELTLLLTRRSAELKHHAGQIAFPGGRMEDSDHDVVEAALRETREEIGVAPERVSVLGSLGAMATVTGYAVTPIVGSMAGDTPLTLDPTEVEYAFEVPLDYFLDRRNAIRGDREYLGHKIPGVEYHYDGHRIWGATAHMIVELIKII